MFGCFNSNIKCSASLKSIFNLLQEQMFGLTKTTDGSPFENN